MIRPEWVASVFEVCNFPERSGPLYGYQRAQITAELNWAIDHAKYYQCHVVALGRACGECVGCLHDPGNDASSGKAGAADDRLDQSLFAPFVEIGVHRFTEAVGVDHKQVA